MQFTHFYHNCLRVAQLNTSMCMYTYLSLSAWLLVHFIQYHQLPLYEIHLACCTWKYLCKQIK